MFLLSLCYFDRLLRRSAVHCQYNLEMFAWDFIFLEFHAEFRMTFRGNFLPLHKIQLCFHIDRHQSIRDGHNACEYIVINACFVLLVLYDALKCFTSPKTFWLLMQVSRFQGHFLLKSAALPHFRFLFLHQENNSICLQTSLIFQK